MIDPVYKGGPKLGAQITPPPYPTVELCDDQGAAGYEGAEGGDDWSLECLQTTHSEYSDDYLSPLPWQESCNSSRTDVCESRPLSMTDFGDSLIECDQAEQDFKKLFMEVTETDEFSEKICLSRQQQMLQPASDLVSTTTESTLTKQMAPKHMDEVSRRLYKVLYGYDVELIDSESEDVSAVPENASPEDIQTGVTAEKQTKINDVSNFDHEIEQDTISGDHDVKSSYSVNLTTQELAGPSDVSDTFPVLSQKNEFMSSACLTQVSHDSTFGQVDVQSVIPGVEHSFEKTLPFRKKEPENETAFSRQSTSETKTCKCSALSKSTSETTESFSSVHKRTSEHVTDITVLLMESRSSSPESVLSVNELNLLAPDSPVPQFRPLSPLPPPIFPWETSDVAAYPLVSAPGGATILLNSEVEERPLTPMVSNKRPFGRPVSPGSDYSERGISPQSLSFDIEDRTSSPESVFLEPMHWLFRSSEHGIMSPDFHEIRSSSPESIGSITEQSWLQPDSPIPEFKQAVSGIFMSCECRSSSPESVSSCMEFETTLLLYEAFEKRPSSPESVASINENKVLSADSPVPEFSNNWPGSAIVIIGERSTSPESLSDVEYGSISPASHNHDNRASPASLASESESEAVLPVIEHREEPSLDSAEPAQVACDSLYADHRPQSPKPLVFDRMNKAPISVDLISEYDDDWVIISLCDTDKRPHSLEAVSSYRTVSPESATLDRAGQTTFVSEETCLEKQFETKSSVIVHPEESNNEDKSTTCILSKCREGNSKKYGEIEAHKFPSVVVSVGGQSDAVAPAAGADDVSTNVITKELFPELFDEEKSNKKIPNPVTDKTKSGIEKKSLKTDCKSLQNVPEYQKQSSECKMATHEETQASGRILSLPLPLETACDNLSLAFSNNVSKDEQLLRESSASESQCHITLSEYSVPVYTLAIDTKLQRLISHIQDPQYVGKTFTSKIEEVQFSGTRTEFYPAPLYETADNENAASENDQRSLLPGEYRCMSAESLRAMDSLTPNSSGRSVASQQPLTPDSAVPQYLVSFSGPSHVHHRIMSTELVFSDMEVETDASFLFEDRQSPDSLSSINIYRSVSPDSPIPEFRQSIPETIFNARLDLSSSFESTSSDQECETALSLFTESRLSSPDSVDENRPFPPESPIPVFQQALPGFSVSVTRTQSLSSVSVCSDLEYGTVSPSQLCSEVRPSSPDSVVSEDGYKDDSPKFNTGFTQAHSVIAHSSSTQSEISHDDMHVFNQRPDSHESQISETTGRPLDDSNQPLRAIRVPVYRLVYDSELWKLISQIHDPHYVGETFCSKTGFFEYAGTRIEYIEEDSCVTRSESEDGVKLDIAESSDVDLLQAVHTKLDEEKRPLSPDSESENRALSPKELIISSLRFDSPESLTELPPDSPVPQFSVDFATISQFHPCLESDEESHHCMPLFSNEDLPFSCSPPKSVDEYNVTSPDSPLPDFTPAVPKSVTAAVGHSSSSPESVYSDIECEFLNSETFMDQRTDSPESLVFTLKEGQSAANATFTEHDSENKLRSHMPEFKQAILDPNVSTDDNRATSPETVYYSHIDYKKSTASISDVCQPPSPDLVASRDDSQALSPDSSVPKFIGRVVERFPSFVRYRSASPESFISNVEEAPLINTSPDTENIQNSPESLKPNIKERTLSLDSESDCRPFLEFQHLSTDSLIFGESLASVSSDLEMEMEFPFSVMSEGRPSSPESLASVSKYRQLSPDSPIPEFRSALPAPCVDVSGYRSSSVSPEWVCSDEDLETDLCIPWLFEDRAETPDSTAPKDELRPLSLDSTIPDFKQTLHKCTIFHMDQRSSSPMSESSDLEMEMEFPFSVMSEGRPSSPESLASVSKYRQLSPDSPIPEFRSALPAPCIDISGYRTSSPESVASDIELAPLISELLEVEERPDSPQSDLSFLEFQCLSPDSPIPQYTHTEPPTVTVIYRSVSPEWVCSDEDLETDLCIPWLFEDRADTPESTASKDELRPLSPDSPIPDFKQTLHKCTIFHMDQRSSSPMSESSDLEMKMEFPISVMSEGRPSSPESLASVSKYRQLSPDSPIPEFRSALPAPCVDISGYRSSSPESIASDIELAPLISELLEVEERPDSPQSALSFLEFQCLSPDSPIPQYTHTEPPTVTVIYRSVSPEWVCSDEDLETDLCIPWLFEDRAETPDSTAPKDELRPLSPDSPIPDFKQTLHKCTIFHMDQRSSSPMSESSDLEMEMEFPISVMSEGRPSSPESLASVSKYRQLSPDSPIPEFQSALPAPCVDISGYRSSSPESVASDIELAPLISELLEVEERPDSPQSALSFLEFQCLSPDSPIPQYTHTEPPTVTVIYRSVSPEWVCSDEDLETDLCIPWLFEDRAETPDSTAPKDELRPLSPDSPIPDFKQTLHKCTIFHMDQRSSSPMSESSDLEMEMEFPISVMSEGRPSSPESLASVSKYRQLSPDSPIPEFRSALPAPCVDISGYRSSSPESIASDIELAPLISELLEVEERPDSPQSALSFLEFQCLSPDSPIPQYTHTEPPTVTVIYRSVSPEWVCSDEDLETDLCIPWLFEDRAETPDSTAPKDELRPLSPDSPIPDFKQTLHKCTIFHMDQRSSSPMSESSDLEMEMEFPISVMSEGRPSSPESLASVSKYRQLSPDSPIPEFQSALPAPCVDISGYRSSSPESVASDIELAPLISELLEVEERPDSPQSALSFLEFQCLSPDSPIPQYTHTEPPTVTVIYRSVSPEWVCSDEDLETDLCIPWLFEDRAETPDSTAPKDELRPLSPDSPIPDFKQTLHKCTIFHMDQRSSSPMSESSDLEMEMEFPISVMSEGRPSSPESLASVSKYRQLSPDSPIPEFQSALPAPCVDISGYRSSSPESVASDIELAPLISELLEVEERPDSPQSALSFLEFQCLSPDSPIPQYTHTEPPTVTVIYRSVSPEWVCSDEDLETDLCIPWLFEDRAETPDSTAPKDELRPLSPDSPIPDFKQTLHKCTIFHMDQRSSSPMSESSDLEIEMEFPISVMSEGRPSSPESLASVSKYRQLSPDSPIPEFQSALPAPCVDISGYRSSSPESVASDIELAPLISELLEVEERPDSPQSALSFLEFQCLSPDSPIPQYTHTEPPTVTVIYRSVSPEWVCSDEDLETDLCIPWLFEDRAETPDSTAPKDELRPLSPDSPIPDFKQTLHKCTIFHMDQRSSSPMSESSDLEMEIEFPFSVMSESRPSSPESLASVSKYRQLSPDSLPPELPIPDFTKTFVEPMRDISPQDFSDSDDLSHTLGLCFAKERSTSSESFASEKQELLLPPKSSITNLKVSTSPDATVDNLSTMMAPTLPEESTIIVAEYNLIYDAELSKLISKVHDPQYTGETFSSKTGFMQLTSSTIQYETRAPDNEQYTKVKDKNEHVANATEAPPEVTHPFTATDTATTNDDNLYTLDAQDISDIPVSESPPSVIEYILSTEAPIYRMTKYAFEVSDPEAQTDSDSDICYSSESLIDPKPLSPNSVMLVEARTSSPASVTSVNELRSLSPDSPLPDYIIALPECVSFLRSASSSPETLASEIDNMSLGVEFQIAECRPSSPESALSGYEAQNERNRPLSSQSLPEYRPLSLESAMQMTEKRASSPESVPEFNANRCLSPDSPIPQFTVSLEEYTTTHRSSSPESLDSDLECELMVTSLRATETERPSSPESISSINAFRRLFPDSPVPDFMRILSSYFMDATSVDRSPSPVSLSSEFEFVASPTECWIDDRPSSPEADESGEELEIFCKGTNEQSKDKKILHTSTGELKSRTDPQRAALHTPEERQFQTDDDVKRKTLSATTVTQDASKIGVLFTADKERKSVPLQLPDQNAYRTHRTVTPVLPSLDNTSSAKAGRLYRYSEWRLSPKETQSSELSSPMSSQFLEPRDYEAVFSGSQTLRVSECSQASLNNFSPVFSDSTAAKAVTDTTTKGESETTEALELSPDFNRVLSEFEKTVSEFESDKAKGPPKELSKGSKSPQQSDSDLEFFECRQTFSDFSEQEDEKLEHNLTYHVSEPPSPMPESSLDIGFLKQGPEHSAHPFLQLEDYKRFSSGSESLGEFAYDSESSRECQAEGDLPVCEELPSRDQAGYYDDDDFLGREIAEELGMLSSDSSEEEVLTTRVVRRRIIIQADNLPDIPSQTMTEEKYTDEHGNMVVKKITRKVIRKYVSADGMETQEVTIEGSHQETVQIEEGDSVSRVVKRTVLHSEGDQKELTFLEPLALGAATTSEFEAEPVQGRKVSKVVKTTVVRGERMEKQMGDPSLAADLPSAKEDFEKALSYAGGFGKVLLPHVVEKEIVQDDGSVVKRLACRMGKPDA
ncbi:ankyrin-2b isoform X2 [Mastacembelus armatus]|uniref:ankyrin-2b isoform X2 n=1 Tax=Mastacembelus armatus TaxID=205130 RepID=UPI000E45ACBD|nr:uncharacterized protein LOC113144484 isoform X2 [Mastacembelus armatus]